MGRNVGGVSRMRAALRERLAEIYNATAQVSVVGWSLGGVYARIWRCSTWHGAVCRDVGKPVRGDVRATTRRGLRGAVRRSVRTIGASSGDIRRSAGSTTSIYSRATAS